MGNYLTTDQSQAGLDLRPRIKLFSKMKAGTGNGDEPLEVMGLKHFILPFTLLGAGLVLSTVVGFLELAFYKI